MLLLQIATIALAASKNVYGVTVTHCTGLQSMRAVLHCIAIHVCWSVLHCSLCCCNLCVPYCAVICIVSVFVCSTTQCFTAARWSTWTCNLHSDRSDW